MKVLLGGEGEYFTEGAEMIYEWGFINLIEETKIMYGFFFFNFSIWVFFHEHSRFMRHQGKGRVSI